MPRRTCLACAVRRIAACVLQQRLADSELADWLRDGAHEPLNDVAAPGRSGEPAQRQPAALRSPPAAAAGARHQPPEPARTDAPRLRRQRLARTAHAADRDPRLPRTARSRGRARTGADARRDARAVQAHGPDRRGPADPVAPGNPARRRRRTRADGAAARHRAQGSRGAQPGPPHRSRWNRRPRPTCSARPRTCTARCPTWSAMPCATPRPAAASPSAGSATPNGAVYSVSDTGFGIPASAPGPAYRALLPGLVQPLARQRRHRPGPVDRQARAEPAPGAAADREHAGRGLDLLLPLRPRHACWRPAATTKAERRGGAACHLAAPHGPE